MKRRATTGAPNLLRLLASRHIKDVFVAECKDGPTHYSNHLRMDGWAMTKSWANPRVCAYEIKVSRSDFVGDNKWPGYLPYCNEFYFVTPKDLIDISEVPEVAGLLVAIGQGPGSRLICKKKAPYRDIMIPDSIYRYILMCRVKVTADSDPMESRQDHWRVWLAQKAEDQKLGYEVAKRIRERAVELEIENTRLKRAMQNYDSIKATMARLGFNSHAPDSWQFEQRLAEHRAVFNPELIREMKTARNVLDATLDRIAQIELAALSAVKEGEGGIIELGE